MLEEVVMTYVEEDGRNSMQIYLDAWFVHFQFACIEIFHRNR